MGAVYSGMSNVTISWHGLLVSAEVSCDPGVRYYPDGSGEPPSSEVDEIEMEVEDEEEFSSFLEDHEKSSEWKTLPDVAFDWIIGKFDDEIVEKLLDKAEF